MIPCCGGSSDSWKALDINRAPLWEELWELSDSEARPCLGATQRFCSPFTFNGFLMDGGLMEPWHMVVHPNEYQKQKKRKLPPQHCFSGVDRLA